MLGAGKVRKRPLTVDSVRSRATALHRAGRLAEAERLCTEVLGRNPADFEILHLRGVIAHQTGRHALAVDLISRAIILRGDAAPAYVNLGSALRALGRNAEALSSYNVALALQPELATALSGSAAALRRLGRPKEAVARARAAYALHPTAEAHCHAGAALCDLRHYPEAVACFDQAIVVKPDCIEAHNYRGIALQRMQRTAEALVSFDQALSLAPGCAELLNNRGNVLRQLRRFTEALACFERALAQQPRCAVTHNNCGLVLQALDRHREAVERYRRALELQPDLAEAHNNLGTVLCELGQPADALISCARAYELQPDIRGIHGNLGNALRDLGRPEEALAHYELALLEDPRSAANHCHRGNAWFDLRQIPEAIADYDKAIAADPQYARARFNKGLCLLLSGDFAQGLRLYEWRKKLDAASANAVSGPAWLGEQEINGRTLFVHAEHGLGDTIQFCRYARLAEERGARVVLAVQPQLCELLTGLSPTIRVIALDEQPGDFDYHCSLMSLPLAFGTTLASIPGHAPYLAPDPVRLALWRQRLAGPGFRVGIVWQGSRHRIDIGRSPPLKAFGRLTNIPGVRLISLQKGEGVEQLRRELKRFPVELLAEDFDAGPQAFLDSAAVMCNLDLIITADTAAAHLAGALNCPTWVTLKDVPDWRWLLDRSDTPWYPSVRLFRQSHRGDWEGVFDALHSELDRVTGSKSPLSGGPIPTSPS